MPKATLKRAFDLALLVPTVPLFLTLTAALALLVRLVDGRPVFFFQERLGRGRRPFRLVKLRTMTTEAEVAARRPTRLGAVLRRHGLDELPQLVHILVGDMSLVGPRPLTPADAARLIGRCPAFAARYAAKPGLTGLAQVHHTTGLEQTAALDAEYAARQGPALDLAILVRTVWINLVGKARGKVQLGA